MALRVYATASLQISQDNAPSPAEPTFGSGQKSFTDTTAYAYSTGATIKLAAGATNQAVGLGTLTEADVIYLLSDSDGITIKLTPTGGSASGAITLVKNVPCILGMKLSAISLSNPGVDDAKVVFGAAGN